MEIHIARSCTPAFLSTYIDKAGYSSWRVAVEMFAMACPCFACCCGRKRQDRRQTWMVFVRFKCTQGAHVRHCASRRSTHLHPATGLRAKTRGCRNFLRHCTGGGGGGRQGRNYAVNDTVASRTVLRVKGFQRDRPLWSILNVSSATHSLAYLRHTHV